MVNTIETGVLDAPLVIFEKFAAESLLGAETASDTIADAAAEIEEVLEGTGRCCNQSAFDMQRST